MLGRKSEVIALNKVLNQAEVRPLAIEWKFSVARMSKNGLQLMNFDFGSQNSYLQSDLPCRVHINSHYAVSFWAVAKTPTFVSEIIRYRLGNHGQVRKVRY